MKAAHTVLYMNKHTQTYASYPAMDISLYERGVDLEVEGVRYIEMHRGPGQKKCLAYFRLRSTVIAHAQHMRAAPLQASIGIQRAARNYIILI